MPLSSNYSFIPKSCIAPLSPQGWKVLQNKECQLKLNKNLK